MKATTLRTLVGVTTPVILIGSVQAGFTGISTTSKPNPFGLLVVNLYAEFDRPGEDHMLAVAGTANAPLLIQVLGGGTFFNANGGTDQPPNCFFPCNLPSLAFDTFVTIGVKAVGFGAGKQPDDHMVLTSEWPGFGTSTLETSNAGWEITQLDAQAVRQRSRSSSTTQARPSSSGRRTDQHC